MSTSDLYVLNGKSTRQFAAFRNGWGSAPMAWDHLAAKYIPERPVYSMSESHMRKVWDLATDERLQHHERVVLMLTFDRSYVPVANLTDAADACEKFGAECENGKQVNHWQAIGAELKRAGGMHLGRHARGLCLSCTSVSDQWGWPNAKQLADAWAIYTAPELSDQKGASDGPLP